MGVCSLLCRNRQIAPADCIQGVSLKHDGTNGTVKMASVPGPSVSVRHRWDTQTGP